MLFLPKYGTIGVWADAEIAPAVTTVTTAASETKEPSGMRARIGSTSERWGDIRKAADDLTLTGGACKRRARQFGPWSPAVAAGPLFPVPPLVLPRRRQPTPFGD